MRDSSLRTSSRIRSSVYSRELELKHCLPLLFVSDLFLLLAVELRQNSPGGEGGRVRETSNGIKELDLSGQWQCQLFRLLVFHDIVMLVLPLAPEVNDAQFLPEVKEWLIS